MKQSRFTDSQIMAILKQAEKGLIVPNVCREHGISVPTFYKWRAKFGGMDASLIARMKELEDENARLKKMFIQIRIKNYLLAEVLGKKALSNRIFFHTIVDHDWSVYASQIIDKVLETQMDHIEALAETHLEKWRDQCGLCGVENDFDSDKNLNYATFRAT